MGKVLPKKTKKSHKDFEKKKVKVGKKLQRGNLTKVNLKTRKINLPSQSLILEDQDNSNEAEVFAHIIKELHHYNDSHRIQAMQDAKNFLSTSKNPKSYLTLLYPEMLELLFKDEELIRDSLLEALTSLIHKYGIEPIYSILDVVMSFINSGISNVDKLIRRDSLQLLYEITSKDSNILTSYRNQIISMLLVVLKDKTMTNTISSTKNENQPTKSVSQQTNSIKPPSSNENKATSQLERKRTKSSKKRATIFNLSIQIIHNLLDDTTNSTKADNESMSTNQYDSFVLFQSRPIDIILTQSTLGSSSDSTLDSTLIYDLLDKLSSIWSDIISIEEGVVSKANQTLLQQIVQMYSTLFKQLFLQDKINQMANNNNLGKLHDLYHKNMLMIMSQFPYASYEVSTAIPNSNDEYQAKLQIEYFNLNICQLLLTYVTHLTNCNRLIHSNKYESILTYLMELSKEIFTFMKYSNQSTQIENALPSSTLDKLSSKKNDKDDKDQFIQNIYSKFYECIILHISTQSLSQLEHQANIWTLYLTEIEITLKFYNNLYPLSSHTPTSSPLKIPHRPVLVSTINCLSQLISSFANSVQTTSNLTEKTFSIFQQLGSVVHSFMSLLNYFQATKRFSVLSTLIDNFFHQCFQFLLIFDEEELVVLPEKYPQFYTILEKSTSFIKLHSDLLISMTPEELKNNKHLFLFKSIKNILDLWSKFPIQLFHQTTPYLLPLVSHPSILMNKEYSEFFEYFLSIKTFRSLNGFNDSNFSLKEFFPLLIHSCKQSVQELLLKNDTNNLTITKQHETFILESTYCRNLPSSIAAFVIAMTSFYSIDKINVILQESLDEITFFSTSSSSNQSSQNYWQTLTLLHIIIKVFKYFQIENKYSNISELNSNSQLLLQQLQETIIQLLIKVLHPSFTITSSNEIDTLESIYFFPFIKQLSLLQQEFSSFPAFFQKFLETYSSFLSLETISEQIVEDNFYRLRAFIHGYLFITQNKQVELVDIVQEWTKTLRIKAISSFSEQNPILLNAIERALNDILFCFS